VTIINDILDFSKIESGRMDIESRPFQLHHTIEAVLKLLAPKAAEKQIALLSTLERGGSSIPETVVGDITRVRQVLINLVANAIKFTREGSVTVAR